MAEIVVLGAGLGGTLAAFEVAEQARTEDHVTLVGQGGVFQFTPSNPWVAVGWRGRSDIEVPLERVMQRKRIRLRTEGAVRVIPAENRVELTGGESLAYDTNRPNGRLFRPFGRLVSRAGLAGGGARNMTHTGRR